MMSGFAAVPTTGGISVRVLRAFVRRHLCKFMGELHQKVLAGARSGLWGSSTVWVGSSLTTESRYPVKLLQYNVAGFERRFAGLMAFFRSFFLAVAVLAATIVAAHADKRVALVIGNSAYKNVNRLKNPANDAATIVAVFKAAGFDSVDLRQDLNVVEMRRALREFGNKTRDADVAVIYYAGHGIELDGTNYLIPIDAALETDTDVYDETFALGRRRTGQTASPCHSGRLP